MKISTTLALGALLSASACTLPAQQSMPDMPGMSQMPQAPAPQTQKPKPKPNRTPVPADPTPMDLRNMGHDAGDPRARAASQSERNSVAQQQTPAGQKPGPASDATSLQLPIQQLQEPEAVGFHTGADLPAPELLRDVVPRAPMTVDAFLALADQGNPTLAEAQRDLDRSAAQARQIGLPPDPTVGYSGDHIRGGSYHGGEEGAFFSQIFVLGRKLALRRDIYRAEGKANQFAVDIQRARIHDDVGRAFVDALAQQESVVLHDRLLKVALDAETNAHELERVGQADATDVLDAEIAAEQAKVDFEQSQRLFLAAFAQLATLSGQAHLDPHPLTGALVEPPELDPAQLVDRDAAESPVIQQAQANVLTAEARLRDAKRERVPDLDLKAGEWYSGEELNTGQKTGWMSFAEAGVQLPLWNHNQGNIGAAKAELSRAHSDVTRTELYTRHRAEPLAEQYQDARFTADRYRTEMLPRARRAYQLEVTKYQQMAQSYPHVLAAQHMLFTLQLSYVHALDEEWRDAIALENYTLTDALDAPASTGDDTTTRNTPTSPGLSQ